MKLLKPTVKTVIEDGSVHGLLQRILDKLEAMADGINILLCNLGHGGGGEQGSARRTTTDQQQ